MADSIGLEPIKRIIAHSLANCSFNLSGNCPHNNWHNLKKSESNNKNFIGVCASKF
nr:MAG TPA: hypothetical protein [Caudoviricetes sp.]